jgi:hypothetical protein
MSRVLSPWVVLALVAATARCQQVTVETPLIGIQDSYYEQFNVGWGFNWRGPNGLGFVQFGGPPPALPPFGGFNPNAGAHFGIARQWGNGSFSFNLSAAQGYSSSMTMNAPHVTMMNGVPGFVQDVTVRPFVTGLIPVVGGYPAWGYTPLPVAVPVRVNPLVEKWQRLQYERRRAPRSEPTDTAPAAAQAEPAPRGSPSARLDSSAERGEISVAEIRRLQAAEDARQRQEIEQLIAEGREAESQGRMSIARVRYRQAAARSDGEQRQRLLRAADRLENK